MKCYICDKELSLKEVVPNPEVRGGYEPCSTCLEVALDAAYGHDRYLTDEPVLDPEWDNMTGDSSDIVGPSWINE